MTLEIERILTISTGHLTETTRLMLDHPKARNSLGRGPTASSEFGWVFWAELLEDIPFLEELMPKDLLEVLKFTEQQDCAYVRLDADGDQVEGLEYYD
jgi:hypothetical protein